MELKNKMSGSLYIHEYPSGEVYSGHFRLQQKKKFNKAIAEELRSLAMEFDVPIFTATQTNRDVLLYRK